jgi:hypothetical protein
MVSKSDVILCIYVTISKEVEEPQKPDIAERLLEGRMEELIVMAIHIPVPIPIPEEAEEALGAVVASVAVVIAIEGLAVGIEDLT